LRDPRWRFCSRFWDWEHRHSHLGGAGWSSGSGPPSGARGPVGSLPNVALWSHSCS
jgi:hypothetical protein